MYYAVRKGKEPGIYTSWDECKKNTIGFKGAEFKKFDTKDEAEGFMKKEENSVKLPITTYAFTDGSFNPDTGYYGYGGFVVHENKKYTLQGCGNDEDMASMRNVSGELLGAMAAIDKAIDLGADSLTIYYDYYGIKKWATGEWKRNKEGTKQYYDYIQQALKEIDLSFIHVKSHSGIEGNEEADYLAKDSVGLTYAE
jgi:ribonuclease HI